MTQMNQNTTDLQAILTAINELKEEVNSIASYYTGTSAPDNSLGEDGDLFFVLG